MAYVSRGRAHTPPASNFTPGGRTHRILAAQAQRPGSFRRIAAAIGLAEPVPANRRKKVWSLLAELERAKILGRDGKDFHLLPDGEETLARLNTALGYEPRQPRPTPSVRYFHPREAAAHG